MRTTDNSTKIALLLVAALAVVAGCRYDQGGKSAASVSGEWPALTALPCVAAPGEAELLYESGELALYAGETAEDSAHNKARDPESLDPYRNSLFLRRRRANVANSWPASSAGPRHCGAVWG